MTLAEALRDAVRIIRLRGNAGNQEFERQANDCVKDARAALAAHDAQQQEPDAKDAEQQLSEQVQVLDAKCAEYEADAARYRWLRDVNDLTLRSTVGSKWTRLDGTVFFSRHYLACNGRQCESEDSLDKAIDAAMKEPTP
jgi:hypothetical protein